MTKKHFFSCPEAVDPSSLYGFSWMEYATAIPSPLVAVTSYKSNGKPNVAMQSWCTFTSDSSGFYALFGAVNRHQHMYASVKETGCMVVNFPSQGCFAACMSSIQNNGDDTDEIAASGLTAEPAVTVNAPQIKECFLNLECELLWEKELSSDGNLMVFCAKVLGFSMDKDHYTPSGTNRYGEDGYLYNIRSPMDPETGARQGAALGILHALPPY